MSEVELFYNYVRQYVSYDTSICIDDDEIGYYLVINDQFTCMVCLLLTLFYYCVKGLQ